MRNPDNGREWFPRTVAGSPAGAFSTSAGDVPGRPNRAAALAILADLAGDAVPADRRPVRLTSLRTGDVAGARLDGLDKIARALGDAVRGATDVSIAVETLPDGTARLAARARREAAAEPEIDHEAERARLEFYRVARGDRA